MFPPCVEFGVYDADVLPPRFANARPIRGKKAGASERLLSDATHYEIDEFEYALHKQTSRSLWYEEFSLSIFILVSFFVHLIYTWHLYRFINITNYYWDFAENVKNNTFISTTYSEELFILKNVSSTFSHAVYPLIDLGFGTMCCAFGLGLCIFGSCIMVWHLKRSQELLFLHFLTFVILVVSALSYAYGFNEQVARLGDFMNSLHNASLGIPVELPTLNYNFSRKLSDYEFKNDCCGWDSPINYWQPTGFYNNSWFFQCVDDRSDILTADVRVCIVPYSCHKALGRFYGDFVKPPKIHADKVPYINWYDKYKGFVMKGKLSAFFTQPYGCDNTIINPVYFIVPCLVMDVFTCLMSLYIILKVTIKFKFCCRRKDGALDHIYASLTHSREMNRFIAEERNQDLTPEERATLVHTTPLRTKDEGILINKSTPRKASLKVVPGEMGKPAPTQSVSMKKSTW